MMDTQTFDGAIQDILAVVPNRATDLARLRRLMLKGTYPTITVLGKYNHGKSRLLNELIGQDIFSVADKRETVQLAEHLSREVCWLDAPGLDADVAAVDDDYAHDAVWTQADIRLFVHSVREGELDAAEQHLLKQLVEDQQHSQRQTLLVLTQVDQMPDQAILADIQQSIGKQVSGLELLPVSATRHRQGIENNKPLLVEKSGLAALRSALELAINQVPQARTHEKAQLFSGIQQQLAELYTSQKALQHQLQQTQQQQRQDFEQGLIAVLDKVSEDLQPILQITGQDDALVADSFATMFKMTAGKQQRAKVQIAYSRACIDINSHLIRHGVVGLPEEQQTHVRSLDTVIVAVLGVSVKFREDLRKIFCTEPERERLQREFSYYFERSSGREALAAQLRQVTQQLGTIEQAQAALKMLEDAA